MCNTFCGCDTCVTFRGVTHVMCNTFRGSVTHV